MKVGTKIFSVIALSAMLVATWVWVSPIHFDNQPQFAAQLEKTNAEELEVALTTASETGAIESISADDKQRLEQIGAAKAEAARLANTVAASAHTSATPKPDSPMKLPPAGTALKDMFDALADQAGNGDDQAACRLGLELSRCQHWTIATQDAVQFQQRLQALNQVYPHAEEAESYRNAVLQAEQLSQQVCQGYSGDTGAAMEWLGMAAMRGHLPSMQRLLVHPPSIQGDEATRMARLSFFNSHIENFATQLVAAGEVSALLALSRAYQSRAWAPQQLRDAIAPNPVRALTLYHLMPDAYKPWLNGKPMEAHIYDPSLSDAQRAEALANAEQLRAQISQHASAPPMAKPRSIRLPARGVPGMLEAFAYNAEDCEK